MLENNQKLIEVFADSLGVSSELIVDELKYNSIPEWDSIAHMILIGQLEDAFDVMLDTNHIIDMSSVAKAREILATYNVVF